MLTPDLSLNLALQFILLGLEPFKRAEFLVIKCNKVSSKVH